MNGENLQLSPDQAAVVESQASALVVVAPAGSGKTEVLARRIARILASSVDEGFRVLALSYTVKAADELKNRLSHRLGELARRVDADTTHGFALALLRSHGTRIGLPVEPEILTRDEDRVELLASWLADANLYLPEDPAAFLRTMDLARAQRVASEHQDEWHQALMSRGAIDYPAMLERAIELTDGKWISSYLRRLYGHVAIDEAQNLTRLQVDLIANVVGHAESSHVPLTIVGDERQSIVGFAGADSRLIGELGSTYGAARIELGTNFRSARKIAEMGRRISAALDVPSTIDDRQYPAAGHVDTRRYQDETAEAEGVGDWISDLLANGVPESAIAPGENSVVGPEDIAVLARTGSALTSIRDALSRRDISVAQASTEDDWVRSLTAKLVLAIIRYKTSPDHSSTLRQISRLAGVRVSSGTAVRDLGAAAHSDVRALTALEHAMTPEQLLQACEGLDPDDDPNWIDDLRLLTDTYRSFADQYRVAERTFGNFNQFLARSQRGDSLSEGVRLLTVHKAQGREFKAVAFIACNDGQIPDFRARTEAEKLDELRVFYVAISRATRVMRFTRAVTRRTRYGSRSTDASPFVVLALTE